MDPIVHYFLHGDSLRVSPSPLFDAHFYHEAYPDVERAGMVALVHFLRHGEPEGRDPHPLFETHFVRSQFGPDIRGNALTIYLASAGAKWKPHPLVDAQYIWEQQQVLSPGDDRPSLLYYLDSDAEDINPSRDFDGHSYLSMYDDVEGMNPLYHYARYGAREGRLVIKEKNSLKLVAAQIEEMANIEPDILKPGRDYYKLVMTDSYDARRMEFQLHARLQKSCGNLKFNHVFLTPWLKRGGADKVLINCVDALLAAAPEERVLILCTQQEDLDGASWLKHADRVRIVSIHDVIDDANSTYVAFCNWLRLAGCQNLFVMNSGFGWNVVSGYGRVLMNFMTTYAFTFCYDYDRFGRNASYAWTHLRRSLDGVTMYISDNMQTMDQFARDHFLSAAERAKFHCLYQPVDDALRGRCELQLSHNLLAGADLRHRVLWAGRFDRQKGLEVVVEIAKAAPDLDFLVYGGVEEEWPDRPKAIPDNLRVLGPYESFAALPLHEASLFLHTSHWDGLPNVLLEAGCAGLPVVATDVGGVSDLVDETTGWLVPHGSEPDRYVDAIREIFAHPEEALARRERMSARILERHSLETFRHQWARLVALGASSRRVEEPCVNAAEGAR